MPLGFLSLLLVFFFVLPAKAQHSEVEVTGKIVSETNNAPVEFATVSILSSEDSTFVKGDITDMAGNFTVSLQPGAYIIKAQFLSFEDAFKEIQVPATVKSRNIGTIRMSEDIERLAEVVVRGERTQMEMTLDKRVYNIGQDLVNRGGNAAQVLDNLPSVTVDMDGNVSLRGSSSVKVLINGKPSGLVGIGGTEALRQLDANMIERVEVITNPSARYEAAGMAGIINIVLHKEQRPGVNGSINLNTGVPHDHGAGLNLNYRKSWFNLFGNYTVSYEDNPREGSSFQKFSDYITNIDRQMNRRGTSNSFRIGSDFFINDKNTVTASAIYRISDDRMDTDVHYFDEGIGETWQSRTNRFNDESEDENVLEYSVNYTRKFSQEDHSLVLDVQYQRNSETENADISEVTIADAVETTLQGYLNNEFQSEYLIQADYVRPLGEKSKFETGWRSSIRKIDNSYRVEEQNEHGIWLPLAQFTNDFIYDEKIHAFYALYGTEINKFSFQGGVRGEYTDVATVLEQTLEKNDNEYLHVFPSIHLTYDFDGKNSLQLSYGKRFNRPGFRMLNPFFSYSDSRNIRTGNPLLKPEFTDSYELGYLRTWKNGTFYFGSYFRHTTDEFDRIETKEDSVIFIYPINLSTENSFGFEANFSRELFNRLNLDGNANFFRAVSRGEWQGIDLSNETLTMMARLNAQLDLFDDYTFQANGFYMAPHSTTQGRQKSMYGMDIGISKDVFNQKGTLVFNVRNVLNSMKWRGETFGEDFYSNSVFQWRPRQYTLSFVYRINTSKEQMRNRQQRRSSGGMEEDFNGDF